MVTSHPDMVLSDPDGMYTVHAPKPWKLVKVQQQLKAPKDNLVSETTTLKGPLKAVNGNNTSLEMRLERLEKVLQR